ncbi:helix-turn-helix domain-containing protein [Thalassotalea castellviae]|uniref:Helix-turn-helix transcriptional regulator n=1 Tax=Thalassotalea castellviae TaxID=3075612 RepID=A0ABU3A0V3_9GAMM|nr:helix-turn-helix transcriptional regulator [Thalassotalea sp. W431]MDT0603498.1 helix-turn-helix transcriptional regulator [Thalassotalea sp. W431]
MAENMNFQDVLNAVANGDSDNMTSKKLGISRTMFSKYRNGHKTPSDEMLEKMIAISGLDPTQAYLATYAEKLHNPRVAEAFRHLAA